MQQADQIDSNNTKARTIHIASAGHAFFALTMIGLGIVGLIQRDFPPTWSGLTKAVPGRNVLIYLCAFVSLVTGIGLLWRRTATLASRVLLTYFLLWLLLVKGYIVLRGPTALLTWWAVGDTAVMTAAAWVLYIWLAGDWDRQRLSFATGDWGLRIARVLYGLALIPFGIAHFVYLKETVVDVPTWLPWHTFWAYFTGVTFIVAGAAVVLGVNARLAAVLSALQICLFTLLIWAPIVKAHPNAFQWAEFLNSWALTAGAWMVARSYRGTPWLGLGKR